MDNNTASKISLPEAFKKRMSSLLSDEYDAFIESYNNDKSYGLRINPLKYNVNDIGKLDFNLKRVPWCTTGFYADINERPGKHPLHEAGAYYIQEPSAMSVVSLLDPKPGDTVLDLCAAPGGKSTQIAGCLNGEGLLVSNEIFPARAKILSQNIERLGIRNVLVCNESPENMSYHFPHFFDHIVVDAPCSGEGMFRKDETAVKEWSEENVENCAKRQKMILEYADVMLKSGGTMVYSTCTFAPSEDEEMLLWFLRTHPDYTVSDWKEAGLPTDAGLESGRCDFVSEEYLPLTEEEKNAIESSLRLWPHKLSGEGHFAVKLIKSGKLNTEISKKKNKKDIRSKNTLSKAESKEFFSFLDDIIDSKAYTSRHFEYFGDELYMYPEGIDATDGIKVVRAGLHIATRKKNRYEPAHAFAMSLKPDDVKRYVVCDKETALKYLHGETININDVATDSTNLKGWVLVTYMGCSLGWGKAGGNVIKNHYPKGLRINLDNKI